MAMTMVGTQAPQRLFGDIPAEARQIPGMVTPETTAAMPSYVDWAGIINAQNAQRAQSRASWAQAAAINNARMAQGGQDQGHYLPPTASQTSGMGAQPASGQGPVLWAPRNITGPQLGTWAEGQQKRAMAENRAQPLIMQAHVGDPFSPGEPGGAPSTTGGGIFGPGITSPMGGANPYELAKGLARRGSVGRTRKGKAPNAFPEESLQERTASGPQYQYDMFGGR